MICVSIDSSSLVANCERFASGSSASAAASERVLPCTSCIVSSLPVLALSMHAGTPQAKRLGVPCLRDSHRFHVAHFNPVIKFIVEGYYEPSR